MPRTGNLVGGAVDKKRSLFGCSAPVSWSLDVGHAEPDRVRRCGAGGFRVAAAIGTSAHTSGSCGPGGRISKRRSLRERLFRLLLAAASGMVAGAWRTTAVASRLLCAHRA